MNNFLKIIRTLRKSTLIDIGNKMGMNTSDLNKDSLISSLENKIKPRFFNTTIFQIGFPFLTALFGVFIGMLIDISNVEVSDNIITSQETQSVLNSNIRNWTLIIDLKKKLQPDELLDEDMFTITNGFLLRFHDSNASNRKSLSVLTTIIYSGNKDGLTWGFNSESYTIQEYRTNIRTGYGIASPDNELSSIPLAISLTNSKNKPFIKVNELDEISIDLFLPKKIAELTSKIRIAVNSGYSFTKHLLIFEKIVDMGDWEKTDYKINNNYPSTKMDIKNIFYKNTIKNKKDWKINLKEAIKVENELGLPDHYRIPY